MNKQVKLQAYSLVGFGVSLCGLLAVLGGCVWLHPLSPSPTIFPTETALPTVTPTQTSLPTIAPTETVLPTITPTPTPLPTIAPTETALPTITLTPTPLPTTPLPTPTMTVVPTATPKGMHFRMLGAACSTEHCLFSDGDTRFIIGVATLVGYYTPVERFGFGNEPETCDSFVVVDGAQDLIRSFVELVDAGNTINSKNELNQPVINIDLSVLSETEQQHILETTMETPVSLIVLRRRLAFPEGVGACYSLVDILRVE